MNPQAKVREIVDLSKMLLEAEYETASVGVRVHWCVNPTPRPIMPIGRKKALRSVHTLLKIGPATLELAAESYTLAVMFFASRS